MDDCFHQVTDAALNIGSHLFDQRSLFHASLPALCASLSVCINISVISFRTAFPKAMAAYFAASCTMPIKDRMLGIRSMNLANRLLSELVTSGGIAC